MDVYQDTIILCGTNLFSVDGKLLQSFERKELSDLCFTYSGTIIFCLKNQCAEIEIYGQTSNGYKKEFSYKLLEDCTCANVEKLKESPKKQGLMFAIVGD